MKTSGLRAGIKATSAHLKLIWAFALSTLALTACDQKFSFNEVQRSCTPPPSSARFGVNPGPVILQPVEYQPFNNTLTVSGTCEPGYDVHIRGKDAASAQTVQCVNGQFSAVVGFTNGDGVKELDVSQNTNDGNDVLDRRCFTKDTVPPQVVIHGNNGAQSTNQTTVRLEGSCESGLDVVISGPNLVAPVTTQCVRGSFSATVTFTGPDGLKNVVASQVDPAGNAGQDDKDYMIDVTPPAVVITSPAANSLTRGELTLGGQCESGVRVFITGAGLNTAAVSTDCVNGQFSVPVTLSAGDGAKNLIATQTDMAGNTGSDNRNFMKDATPPLVRIATPDANSYSNGSLTLTGSCESGLQVSLSGNGLAAPQSVACAGGAFTANLTLAGPDGLKNIIAAQTDAAGNMGSDNRSFHRDTVAPAVTITQPAAPAVANRNVTIAGTCETGLQVTLDGAGLTAVATTACNNGNFSITTQLSNGDGVKLLRASQTDLAGNTGTATRNVTLDTNGPAVAITAPAANAYVGNTATITGTCETGLNVSLSGTGLAANVTTPCTGGAFSQLVTFSAGEGNKTVVAAQTDAVGNMGSDSRTFIKDTVAPVVTITAPNADSIHRENLTLTGACETGLPVNISGAGAVATSTTCNNGAYSVLVTLSAGDGLKTISASQTDGAGNTGTVSRNFYRDSDAPVIAIQNPPANSSWVNGVTLTGICESDLPIAVSGAGVQSPSSATCNSGAFSFSVVFTAGDGVKTVTVSQTDAAGNMGSDSRNFIKDSTAPVVRINAPAEGLVNTPGVTLTGVCETGLTVALSGAGLQSPNSTSCVNGAFSVAVTFTSGDGNKVITASQTDAAGNMGSDSKTYLRDSTAPVVAITAPAAGTAAQNGLRVTGTCESGIVVNLSGGGLAAPVQTACVASAFGADIVFSNGDGTKTVTASQTDAAGNTGTSSRDFVRDTTPPAIAFTTPAANAYVPMNSVINGTCESGLLINITGDIVTPVTANCVNGAFTTSVVFTAGDGSRTLNAAQTDLAGNIGTATRSYLRDSTAPMIAITAPAAGTVWQNGLRLEGTCEAGLPVNLSGAGLASPSTTTCAAGTFAVDILFTPGDGNKIIIASQTDEGNNTASDTRTFIRDATAPIVSIQLPSPNTVAQTGVTLVGACETGLNVEISGTGLAAPTFVMCVGGNYSVPITFSNGDGTKTITVSQTDAAGNTGTASRNFVRDSTAPIVAITAPAANTVGSTGLTVSGTCETGLTVVLNGSGVQTPVNAVCAAGAFSAAVTFTAGDGVKNVVASQTDAAGNTGSANRNFVRDSTAPAVAITAPAANTLAQTGVRLEGTCEAGLTVNLSGAGLASPSTTTCAAGTFAVDITFTNGDGNKVIVASQTDAAGNTGSASRTFIKDSTAPVVTIASPAANAAAAVGVTVTGTCETGLNVTLAGSGLASSVNTMCTAGAYSAAVTFSAGEGVKTVTASQTDAAGNTGTASRNFIRDSVAPMVAITAPAANSMVGATATITGTCETGLNVTLNGAGVQTPVNTGCSGGTFSANVTFTPGDGSKTVTAAQMDAAGNIGSDTRAFIRDTTAPAIAITSPAANTVAQTGVRLQGSCETGLTVNLGGAGLQGPATTNCVAGAFDVMITFTNGDGVKAISASQTDAAGNTGTASRNFVRDNTAPAVTIAAPAANTSARTGVTVSGACETGLTVTLSGDITETTASCVAGAYTAAVVFSAGDGSKTVTASQTDGAGNTGTASRAFIRDTVAPAVAITAPAANTQAANGITLMGTCETGLMVTISGDVNAPTNTACNGGTFSAAITFSNGNGAKTITASQTDAAGNTGSDSRNFIKANNAGYYTFTSRGPGGQVDILFVDDNSASMEEEQRRLGDRFSNLATELDEVDWQIGITTTDCSNGTYGICGSLLPMAGTSDYILRPTTPNFVSVFQNTIRRPETFDPIYNQSCILTNSCPSGTEEGLKASMFAMNKRNGDNAGFFRPGADLAIVYLSDEDERGTVGPTSTTPAQVLANFRSIWPTDKKLAAYAIIVRPGDVACYESQRAQFGNNANYGTYYDEMVNLVGGGTFSICDTDYTLTLRQIGQDVTRLSRTIELPQVPIPSTINIVYTPAHTTTYTVNGNRITFDNPAPLGTQVEIFYEYE